MATKTISQRISLIGGKEVSTELKNLGKAGEEAFKNIQSAADKLKGPGISFSQSMSKISTSLKTAGSSIADFGSKTRQMGQTLAIAGAAVAGLGIAFGALVKHGADAATAMGENAQKAGTTIEEFGRLSFAARQAGVDTDSFTQSMARLSNNIDAASKGLGPAAEAFSRLGVDVEGSNGKIRSTEAILQDLAGAFAVMPDGAEKSALAIDLFGRAGTALLPFLNQGKEGIIALGKEAERLGLLFSPEEFAIGDAFGDEVEKMIESLRALGDHIGLVFAPAITEIATSITEFIATNKDSIIGFAEGVRDAFGSLPDSIKIVLAAVGGLVIAVGPALIALGAFIQLIGFSVSGLGSLARVLGFVVSGIGYLGAAFVRVAISIGAALFALGPWGIALGLLAFAVGALAVVIVKNWDKIVEVTRSMAKSVVEFLGNILENATKAAEAIAQPFVDAFQTAKDAAQSFFADVFRGLARVIEAATRAAQAIANIGGGGGGKAEGGIVKKAGGGSVRGAGTSTSDSILARLSDGEFVIKAAAVRKYGERLFWMLNAMRLAPKALGLAGGGFARHLSEAASIGPLPRFAGGGIVTQMSASQRPTSVINLTIGRQTFPVIAAQEVADSLIRAVRQHDLGRA